LPEDDYLDFYAPQQNQISYQLSVKWGISRLPEDDYLDFYAPQQNQISYQFSLYYA